MIMKEETWIDKSLNSMEDAERASAPDGLFSRIQDEIESPVYGTKRNRSWVGIAAAILIVLCSNALIVTNYLDTSESDYNQEEYPEMISDFTLYTNE